MRATGRTIATMVGLWTVVCVLAEAGPPPMSFEGARWIWSSSGLSEDARSYPAEVRFFRAAATVPEGGQVKSAELIVTVDNMFSLYVNGKLAGESEASNNAWGKPKRFDVAGMLVPGRNVVAVEAVNTLPGPAGLIAKLVVRLADGRELVLVSDATWRSSDEEVANWHRPGLDDKVWAEAHVVADFGAMPWRKPAVRSAPVRAGGPLTAARRTTRQDYEALKASAKRGGTSVASVVAEIKPGADYPWPDAVVFLGDDCSLYRPHVHAGNRYDSLSVTIFNPRKSRAFPEHDLPAPMKVGRKLYALKPARPGAKPRLLLDAGKGGIGSPSVSFDGRSVYVSMAYDGEPFFHIYRLPSAGGKPQRLTDGPFHDIDPAELPDGRVVFTSTRIGMFEEYHNPPSRALFVMSAGGSDIRPLTYTFIFDNEPEVMADGRILFIRSDNFFDRGKVETLLHAVHPDGAGGYTEFGLDRGPEYGGRLRAFYCGSPAPMPDGRVAFVSNRGITVGRPGSPLETWQQLGLPAGGVAALPDGRLLCTLPRRVAIEVKVGKKTRKVHDFRYEQIAIVDPRVRRAEVAILHDADGEALHSPVYLGARPRPPVLSARANVHRADDVRATGFLFCQNARFTRHTTAGWSHVRAIRVLAGKGLTTRSSHSYIVHAGSEAVELGTVPLAPDGSFAVEVPADTALAFQAVDAEGRSELNEMSWIYVRPGERRSCLGCHHPRQAVPSNVSPAPLALQTRPLKLTGQGNPHRFRGNNPAVTGLMELQFDRYREVAGLDRHGSPPDPMATGAQEVAALIAQLRGNREGLRISAAQRLSIFRDRAAAPALAERLRDPRREVRVAAAVALAACGTRESVPPLLDALIDSDPLVAQAAGAALENLTGHAQALNPFGERDEWVRQAQEWRAWFQGTNWAKIEQGLVKRVEGADRDVVRRAAVAMGHVGGDASRAALRDYVARERANNPLPEWRKKHRGDGTRFNSLSPVNPRTIQAATRSLGYLKDTKAIPLLAETLASHGNPATGNLFLAEACVEALGRIATPEAESALIAAFAKLQDYPRYTSWYGDHGALMACHASPVHYLVAEALDAMGSTRAGSIVPHLIQSVPTDPDRALFLGNDDCETLIGRVIRRSGSGPAVVETCLAILGDPKATRVKEIEATVARTHRCWAGHPGPENRAAQILSLVCRDRKHAPRVRAAFDRYRAKPVNIPRVFDTGIPVVRTLPLKHWVCFFLARTLGNLADPRSADALIAALAQSPTEAAPGRPDPLGPGVLFLHNDLTPCWRAAVAWALGRIGDRRAVPTLMKIAGDLDNATDTRHAAAVALGRIADRTSIEPLRTLAAAYPEVSTRRALFEACDKLSARNPVGGTSPSRE